MASTDWKWDVFVSHASEDKSRFVGPLVAELKSRNLAVWYDSHEIQPGDDFRKKMDEGLRQSRFGLLVLSPRFFKYWPESEVSALFNQEAVFDVKRILPIRCDLSHAELTGRSPLLGSRAAVGWEAGIPAIADR